MRNFYSYFRKLKKARYLKDNKKITRDKKSLSFVEIRSLGCSLSKDILVSFGNEKVHN